MGGAHRAEIGGDRLGQKLRPSQSFPSRGNGLGQRPEIDGKPVVLGGDLHPTIPQTPDRVIPAVVTKGQLEGARTDGQSEHLVAEADPKDREGPEKAAQRACGRCERFRIAGPIGDEDPIGTERKNVVRGGRRRHHFHLETVAGEVAEDIGLHSQVDGDDQTLSVPFGLEPERFGGRDPRCEVLALHGGCGGSSLFQIGFRHSGPHRHGHRSPVTEMACQPAGIYVAQGDNAMVAEVVGEAPLGAPIRGPPGHGAHHKTRHRRTRRLGVVAGYSVVADVRGGHHDHLTRIGGVGQDLLIAGHRSVEHRLACDHSFGADR